MSNKDCHLKVVGHRWCQRFLLLLFYAFVATIILLQLIAQVKTPNNGDYFNHILAIQQAKLGLIDHQYPLRVVATQIWLYPFYQFYSPTPYTIGGMMYRWLIPSEAATVYQFLLVCALTLGGLFMYRLAYWFVRSRQIALLAGVLYLTAPYYFIIIYHIYAFTETIALGWVPVVIYYTARHFYQSSKHTTFLQMSLAWYLLATTHITTFFYTSVIVAILLLLFTFRHPSFWKNLCGVGLGYFFGFLLAAWYLVPVLLFSQYFAVTGSFVAPDLMTKYFPSFANLLSPFYSMSIGQMRANGSYDTVTQIHPNVSIILLLSFGVCLYAFISKRIHQKFPDNWIGLLLVLFTLIFILIWSPINIWRWLPHYFLVIQYSWRLLGQLLWIGSLLFAWALCWMNGGKLSWRQTAVGILLIFFLGFAHLPFATQTINTSNSQLKLPSFIKPTDYMLNVYTHPELIDLRDNMSFRFFVPSKANYTPTDMRNVWIPTLLLQAADAPSVVLQGLFVDRTPDKKQLIALMDDVVVGKINLQQGLIHWEIPLQPYQYLFNHKSAVNFKFEIVSLGVTKNPTLKSIFTVTQLDLHGFINPKEKMDVLRIQNFCHREKAQVVCTVNVPSNIHLIELPILYYPDLLNVSINGKTVPYKSVLYQNTLVTGVQPEPGKKNIIRFQIDGLRWANLISRAAWLVFSLLGIYILLRRVFHT